MKFIGEAVVFVENVVRRVGCIKAGENILRTNWKVRPQKHSRKDAVSQSHPHKVWYVWSSCSCLLTILITAEWCHSWTILLLYLWSRFFKKVWSWCPWRTRALPGAPPNGLCRFTHCQSGWPASSLGGHSVFCWQMFQQWCLWCRWLVRMQKEQTTKTKETKLKLFLLYNAFGIPFCCPCGIADSFV